MLEGPVGGLRIVFWMNLCRSLQADGLGQARVLHGLCRPRIV